MIEILRENGGEPAELDDSACTHLVSTSWSIVYDSVKKVFAIEAMVFTSVTADKEKWHTNFSVVGSLGESPSRSRNGEQKI